jgi:PadR family transcriptional regulator PadR
MKTELVQGTLDILLLKALTWGPAHGYSLTRWIARTSEDVLQIEEGALYPALHRMEKRGFVEAEWGLSENKRQAKFYRLTARGRQELSAASDSWQRYTEAVGRVLTATS